MSSRCSNCAFGATASENNRQGLPMGSAPAFDEKRASAPWTTHRPVAFERILDLDGVRQWDAEATRQLSAAEAEALGVPKHAFFYMQSRYAPAGTAAHGVGAQSDHWQRPTSPLDWTALAVGICSVALAGGHLIASFS